MGIGLNNRVWYDVVIQNRKEDRDRVAKGMRPRFPEPERFLHLNNIHTTQMMEEYIEAHKTKYDDSGHAIVSTARGRRRNTKLGT